MAYATKESLAEYLGINVMDLPENVDNMLQRASECIDAHTLDRARLFNGDDRIIDATCAQVEFWMTVDPSMDIMGSPTGWSASSFSMTGKLPELAPRAYRLLFVMGLISRGVGAR
jgi:hypothetical protein